MDKLRLYLNSLATAEQAAFASRCGTTVGYLRKAISAKELLRETLCINIERESARAVLCEDLRDDVDWGYLRGSAEAAAQSRTDQATPDLFSGMGRAPVAGA